MNTRDKRLDIIKGFTIIMVVIGHNIQVLKGAEYTQGLFFENTVFSIIYTFHMPVFMLISGYLFHSSINKYTSKTIIINRIKSLIIPIVTWTLLVRISYMIMQGMTFSPSNFILGVLNSLWFLWAVFYCTIALILGKRFFNDSIIFHVLMMILLLLSPNILNKDLYAFMYPYFILGYYVKKNNFNIKKVNIFGIIFAFLVLFYFWGTDKYIYTTGLSLIGRADPFNVFLIDIYRWVIGGLGSVVVVKIVDIVHMKYKRELSFLAYLGRQSLGIYIVNIYLSNYFLINITAFENWNEISYTMVCIALSVVVIGICLLIVNIIKKSKLLNLLLLGNAAKKKADITIQPTSKMFN